MKINALVVDRHRIFAEGLASLMEAEADMTAAGIASTGRQALGLAAALAPDLIIMDPALPDLSGVDVTRLALRQDPDVRVLGLLRPSETALAEQMRAAGASACLSKGTAFPKLAQALRDLHAGRTRVLDDLLDGPGGTRTGGRRRRDRQDKGLSDREAEVLRLISEGRSNAETAKLLTLSPHTVVRHRQNIMTKLRLHSVAELTRYAIRQGLLALD